MNVLKSVLHALTLPAIRNKPLFSLLPPVLASVFLLLYSAMIMSPEQKIEHSFADQFFFSCTILAVILLLAIASYLCFHFHAHMQVFLSAFAVLCGASLGYQFSCSGRNYGFTSHVIFLFAGIFCGVMTFYFWRKYIADFHFGSSKTRFCNNLYIIVLALTVCSLVACFLCKTYKGVKINFYLPFLPISVQPAEFLKIFLIMLGACSFPVGESPYRNRTKAVIFCMMSLLSCVVRGALHHDFGCSLVIGFLFFTMLIYLFDSKLLTGVFFSGAVAAAVYIYSNSKLVEHRIMSTFHAAENENIQQWEFLKAVLYGGFNGLGMEDAHRFTEITQANNDGALAGFLAVYGFPFLLIILAAYSLLILKPAFNSSVHPADHLILIQTAALIFIQIVLNLFGALDCIPFTGLTAPLVSSGGSSLVTFCMLLGLCAASLYPKL